MSDVPEAPEAPAPLEEAPAEEKVKEQRSISVKKLVIVLGSVLVVAAIGVGAYILVTWTTVANSDHDTVLETLATTQGELETTQADLAAALSDIADLQDDLDASNDENARLTGDLDAATAEVADLTATIDATSEEIENIVDFAQTYAAWILASFNVDHLENIGVDLSIGDELAENAGLEGGWDDLSDDFTFWAATWNSLGALDPEIDDLVDAFFDAAWGSQAEDKAVAEFTVLVANYLMEAALAAQAAMGG